MKNKIILIIYNPAAGQHQDQKFDQVLTLLKKSGATVEVVESQYAGHARQLAADSAGAAYDLLVAAGGDGTINEVINGHYPSQKPFGLIPLGTANVLAKELGLDETPAGIAANLIADNTTACRLGRVNGRLFSLVASAGLDSFVVAGVNLRLKKKLGVGAYALSFFRQLFAAPIVTYNLNIDGKKYLAVGVIISKGRYYGGKYICAPEASLTDDSIHAVILERKGRLNSLRYAVAMLTNTLPKAAGVRIVKAKEVAISADGEAPFQIDGDYGGKLPVEVFVSEKPLNIVSK